MAVNGEADGKRPERDVLARAAEGMREITDDGWVRVRGSVLARVLRTVRPTRHVIGRHAYGAFTVASGVLVSQVRDAVDGHDERVRVLDVRCATDDQGYLESVGIAVSVLFGSRIARVTASTRAVTAERISRTIGTDFPLDRVIVDLHVADVHPSADA